MPTFDAIILGLGAMGSSAAYHLARRGARVLGLEQFTPAHDRGSSHGVTRIIRKAYFEHPDYVPLLHSAYRLWAELEAETGRSLFQRTGLLLVGCRDGVAIPGVRRSAGEHKLDIHEVPIGDVARRFPGIVPQPPMEALYEPDAGYLLVEACVRAHLDAAVRHGATLRFNECVRSIHPEGVSGDVRVVTDEGTYSGGALVVCAGPWSAQFLGTLGAKLEVRRKVQLWFGCDDSRYEVSAGFPVFCFDTADGFFYGFPAVEHGRIKVAEHSGGGVVGAAETLERALHESDVARVRDFVTQALPGVAPRVVAHSVCMYTMTPDENFLLQQGTSGLRAFVAAGFSGHGFKFASVIGAVLADFVMNGSTAEPVEFLSAKRFLNEIS